MPRKEDLESLKYHESVVRRMAEKHDDFEEGDPRSLRWPKEHDYDSQARLIRATIHEASPMTVLDLGSGFADTTNLLATKYLPSAVFNAVELNPDFHSIAMKRYGSIPNIEFSNQSYWDALESGRQYDWIYSTGGLWEYCSVRNFERLFWLIVARSKRGFSYLYDRRQSIHSKMPLFIRRLQEVYPNLTFSENLKIKEARQTRGLEGKIKPIIYGCLMFFDKGLNAKDYTGPIPDYISEDESQKVDSDSLKLF